METDKVLLPGYSVLQNIGMGVVLSITGAMSMGNLYIDSATAQTRTVSCVIDDYLACKFRESVDGWKAERRTSPSSSVSRMFASIYYLRIIGMGTAAVPLLLAEMEARPDHWDRALEAITGENPAPPETAGRIRDIARAWVDWGRARQLV